MSAPRAAASHRTLLALALAGAALAGGCAGRRVVLADTVTPIPSQPPITTSGVVGSYDRSTMTLTFEDGRVVRIAARTRVQPSVGGRLRRGEQVIVTDAVPVGVRYPVAPAASSS